jgi:hypothetical protein
MLRTCEFDQRHADGDRPRLAPLSRLVAAPFLSPRRRLQCFPRQLQTPHSTPLTLSVAKNAPRDTIPAATEFSSRQQSLDVAAVSQNSTSLEVANKNALAGLANMADLAASQKPALFHRLTGRRSQSSLSIYFLLFLGASLCPSCLGGSSFSPFRQGVALRLPLLANRQKT